MEDASASHAADDAGADVLTGALERAAATTDPQLRAMLIARAVRTAYRMRKLHRLTGWENLLVEFGGPVLDLVDATRALLADDIRGAVAVLVTAAAGANDQVWTVATAGVAGDALVAATRVGLWRDALELQDLIADLLARIHGSDLDDPELVAVVGGVEFDVLGAAAMIEHQTGPLGAPASTALDALASALEGLRSRHLLGEEHAYALLAYGSVLGGSRRLGPAAVALARAAQLIPIERHDLARWVRAELALVRVRQGRWEDARRLAAELDRDDAEGSMPPMDGVGAALGSTLAALEGRFSTARMLAEVAAADPRRHRTVIVSVLLTHSRLVSAIGRNDWVDLLHALEDRDQQGHKHVFDVHEWHALSALALWHTGNLHEYRALYTAWTRLPGADEHAYRWAHAAIIARIDGDDAAAIEHTQQAVAALHDGYDPLGRTWVRIVAGTHVSLLGDPVEGLTHYEDARTELVALGAGAFADLCTAIIRSTSEAVSQARRDDPSAALTEQQRQIAQLVSSGYTSSEIGELLHLSRKTIDFHVANILTRLGIRNRREIGRVIERRPPASD